MKLYSDTITLAQLDGIAAAHGVTTYNTDTFGKRDRHRGIRFVLRPDDNTPEEYRTRSASGRRVWACSWSAHYAVMADVFDADPTARIVSSLATWDGREDFHARAGDRVDTYGGGTINCHTSGDGVPALTMADSTTRNPQCDAQRCRDEQGRAGRIDAIRGITAEELAAGEDGTYSADVGACSDDLITVWHGLDTPAIACGRHAHYSVIAVFRGHRTRLHEDGEAATR